MQDHNGGGRDLTVKVFIPSSTEPREYTWPRSIRVGEAAQQVATDHGITVENPTLQNAKDEVLERDRPLVAAGVRDGDVLELVSAGGGV